jgi:hypothetical protein
MLTLVLLLLCATFARGDVYKDDSENLAGSFQHFFISTSYVPALELTKDPRLNYFSGLFYFIFAGALLLTGMIVIENSLSIYPLGIIYVAFFFRVYAKIFQTLFEIPTERKTSFAFQRTLIFCVIISLCVGAFYGLTANYYLDFQEKNSEFRWMHATASGVNISSQRVYTSLKECNYSDSSLDEISRFTAFANYFAKISGVIFASSLVSFLMSRKMARNICELW